MSFLKRAVQFAGVSKTSPSQVAGNHKIDGTNVNIERVDDETALALRLAEAKIEALQTSLRQMQEVQAATREKTANVHDQSEHSHLPSKAERKPVAERSPARESATWL